MDYKDSIEQIRQHIKILNEEGGEIRDCISQFKTENAEFHGKMDTDIRWIKAGIWGIFVPLILLVIKAGIDFLK